MLRLKHLSLIGFLIAGNLSFAQSNDAVNPADSTGLPGDHFSLEGALEMFKKAKSLEEFEKALNLENNSVNNLDLNGDDKIDYVRVVDHSKGDAHAIVLQVPVSSTESQDIAVIEVEKNGAQSAILQIIGDQELYGDSTIVEPLDAEDVKDNSMDGKGPYAYKSSSRIVIVNVWFWPCVYYMWQPTYVVWVSPFYWGYYPHWWSPWRPHPWRWHYSHCHHYRYYYHPVWVYRTHNAHVVYGPHRKSSPYVKQRYVVAHKNHMVKSGGKSGYYSKGMNKPGNKPGPKVTKKPNSPPQGPGPKNSGKKPPQTGKKPPHNKPPMQKQPGPPKNKPMNTPKPGNKGGGGQKGKK